MTTPSPKIAEQRGKMIKLLEDAHILADDLEDDNTGHLKERAVGEAAVAAVHAERGPCRIRQVNHTPT